MIYAPPDDNRISEPFEPLELVAGPLEVKWPPFHILGADDNDTQIRYWCSCGWVGGAVAVGTTAIDFVAVEWRAHVRLSNRIIRADRRLHSHPQSEPVDVDAPDPGYSE